MSHYPIHSISTAPIASRQGLEQLHGAFGMLPNIAAAMSNSPILFNGFLGLFTQVHASSLSEAQIQTVLLTNAVTNASAWPVAFHSALALKNGIDAADVEAIRQGQLPNDDGLAALSRMARTLIEKRGQITESDQQDFLAANFSREQILEVLSVVAASTITNYTAGITHPPLEAPFAQFAWKPATR